jgi:hypothetical protein
MELLHDVGHVESCFGLFGDSVIVSARFTICAKLNIGSENHFGCTRWYSSMTRLKWKLISICLETVLVLVQDRCTVCAEYTIGLEIILDAPDGTPR